MFKFLELLPEIGGNKLVVCTEQTLLILCFVEFTLKLKPVGIELKYWLSNIFFANPIQGRSTQFEKIFSTYRDNHSLR